MKMNEKQQAVYDAVEKFPGTGVEVISQVAGIGNRLYLFKILKELTQNGHLLVEDENGDPGYTIRLEGSKNATGIKKVSQERKGKAQEEDLGPPTEGRDTGKYLFEGNTYGKGRLVWAVVKAYHTTNKKVSLGKMQTVFPDTLQKNYGFIVEYPKAKKMSVGRERYFMRDGETMQVAGKRVCVCSQWGNGKNWDEFLEIAKGLGFKIKRA
jgi:hypothetical protein